MVDENGRQTITNDGATVMKLLDIVHPAARILVDIARSQDAEVGDGTTSVVVLAGEILKEVKEHVEAGVSSQIIIKGLRRASAMAVAKIKEIAVDTQDGNRRETLGKLAATAMTSKLIKRNAGFFTKSRLRCGRCMRHISLTVNSGGRRRSVSRSGRPEREAHWHQEDPRRLLDRLHLRQGRRFQEDVLVCRL